MNSDDDLPPRQITNTSRLVADMPEYGLILGMDGGRGIREQEAAGASEMVHSDQIPVRFYANREEMERLGYATPDDVLRSFGFKLGDVTPGDKLFRAATLPEGWRKERTEHPLWTKLVDAAGVERGTIFYKAAFYDRDAHLNLSLPYPAKVEAT